MKRQEKSHMIKCEDMIKIKVFKWKNVIASHSNG